MLLDSTTIDPGELAGRTGWVVKPEGACKGELCVPLPPEVDAGGGRLDALVLADRLAMPLIHDEAHGLWALGPETAAGTALTTVEAPGLELPELASGEPFLLSSLRGTRVALVAWAPW